MTKAVIFDFSGTLFHCEDTESWLRGALGQVGIAATDDEVATYAARLHESGGQPGGHSGFEVPAEYASLWDRRDLSMADHRTAYTALTARAGLPWPGLVDVLYERHYAPEGWEAYPDTVAVLELLRSRGVPVAVLSNTGWDVRAIFKHFNVDRLVSAWVLSCEVGVVKPDPRIFQIACDLLGHAPADVLMVGDDPVADAGAGAIGCAFRLVAHAPVGERPRALLDAVAGAVA
jgi:HAD superfamily hydrolase (TIGR01493 family)